jgi:hypothetical protein
MMVSDGDQLCDEQFHVLDAQQRDHGLQRSPIDPAAHQVPGLIRRGERGLYRPGWLAELPGELCGLKGG